MNRKITIELLKKYANSSCTDEEKAMVESWYNELAKLKNEDDLADEDLCEVKRHLDRYFNSKKMIL